MSDSSDNRANREPFGSDGAAARKLDIEEFKGADQKIDVCALMSSIRARVKSQLAAGRPAAKSMKPREADFNQATRRAGEMVNSEELRYLNINHTYPLRIELDSIKSHRFGPIGKILVFVKRKFKSMLWSQILRDYLDSERDFQAHLVRYLNDLSRYIDARDAANFWELIRKIDVDISKALERIERATDEQTATTLSTERRTVDSLNGVRKDLTHMQSEIASILRLDSVVKGLEGLVAKTSAKSAVSSGGSSNQELPDYSYLLFENRFRGSESEVAERLSQYAAIFKSAPAAVLEIGCGRGELQAIFKQGGIASYGVDLDQAMLEAAKERGLDVRLEDGIRHLEGLPDSSLGGVVAIQVVEHLPHQALKRLLELCATKVKSGGKIVFETINPKSLTALSSNYFRDPSHVFPMHPDTLSYLTTLSGLNVKEVRYLSPVPKAAQFHELPNEEFMSPRWAHVIDELNHNFKQLNNLVFGHQDYCVIAEVR